VDSNVSVQVKRLIDVDKKAIELESRRTRELMELEQSYKDEKNRIDTKLQTAKDDAKKIYEKMVHQAKNEADDIETQLMQKLEVTEETINKELEAIALEWWNKILNDLK
jgi:F0F1-type ATP synthase membrane subunit b/b'